MEKGINMRQRKETPERMVIDGRVADYGVFKDPFHEINLLDLDLKIGDRSVPRFARNMRLKEWQHFGIVHDEYYFGMVVFDAKYMSMSFFFTFNRKSGEFFEHARTGIGTPVRVARELWHGESYFHHIGYRLDFENRLDNGLHRLSADIKARGAKPRVRADIRVLEDLDRVEPLVMVSPLGSGRVQYTHKAVCPVEGTVSVGGREITLDPLKHVGLMDIQKSYFWYNTFWNWATFGGYDEEGRLIGMNACQGLIPETDDEQYNENCTWVDGRINLLSAARFEFEKEKLMDPWKITTTDGGLDVGFNPAGERKGKVNLGVILSDFHQPSGGFTGKMKGTGDSEVDVVDKFGVCEYHLARF